MDLALSFASHYSKIDTMVCLAEEGNATAFLGPLLRAAERGSLDVVQWFVKRGCRDMEICLALTAATASIRVEVSAYLLPHVPHHVLSALSIEIIKAAGERSGGSLEGVAFLLQSDFLADPSATYSVANTIAMSDDESIDPDLRAFLQEHWSEAAFLDGLKQGEDHYLNLLKILNHGESPIQLADIPPPLRVAIAYLPLYRDCTEARGTLLSQRTRGQLIDAIKRLGSNSSNDSALDISTPCKELLGVLEHYLPPCFVRASSGIQ